MTTLANGTYQTKAGSTMKVSGEHGGISEVSFDWLEEGGCCDCQPEAYDSYGCLVWHCDICGGGHAELFATDSRAGADGNSDRT